MQGAIHSPHLRKWLALIVGVAIGCASPLVNFYSVDRTIEYPAGSDFDAFVLRQLETMNKGVEIAIAREDIPKIRRGFRRWAEAIRKSDGVIYDPHDLINRYQLIGAEAKGDKIKQLVEFIANKTADLFSPVNENRRKFYARRVNLALRERQDRLLIYFVQRSDS